VAGIRNAVAAGVTTIEHCTWVSEDDDAEVAYEPAVADEMARKGIYLSPTMSTSRIRAQVPESEVTEARRRAISMRPKIREAQRDMLARGVKLIGSTDAGVANLPLDAMPGELQAVVEELGQTPMQAITAATFTGATAFGKADLIGSLQPGRRADFIAIEGNPGANISDVHKQRW